MYLYIHYDEIPREGKGYPLQYSRLENSMDCVPWGRKESDMTELFALHFTTMKSFFIHYSAIWLFHLGICSMYFHVIKIKQTTHWLWKRKTPWLGLLQSWLPSQWPESNSHQNAGQWKKKKKKNCFIKKMFTVYPILEKYSNLVNQFLKVQWYFQQIIKKKNSRDFPGGPVGKNLPSNEGDAGSIPGWETRIPHALWANKPVHRN